MPVNLVETKWISGNLIFYDKALGPGAAGYLMRITQSAVEIGSSSNEVNLVANGYLQLYNVADAGDTAGQMWFDTDDNEIHFWDGSAEKTVTST